MYAVVLSVGDEVVDGQVVDRNAAWLSRELLRLGVDVMRHEAVRDVEEAIEAAVREAARRAHLVVVSGGLGPTEDDVTRHGVAAAAGVHLELHEPSLARIEERFRRYGRPMPVQNRIQAMVPQGAAVLPNHEGTAPGFVVACQEAQVAVLPGVPREMEAMFVRHLRGLIGAMPVERRPIRTEVLRTFGLPESAINQTIRHLMGRVANPLVGLLVSEGVISVKFTATARTQEQAAGLIRPVREEVRRLLGDAVFGTGEETLEQVVARLLEARRATIAVAESCTGGLIGHYITQVPGISRFFLEDLVTYSDGSKTRVLGVPQETIERVGAVSQEVAAAMAEGVRRRAGADIGLSTTGIAGPGGASPEKPVGLVHFGLATEEGTRTEQRRLVGSRHVVKDRAAKAALDLLRRYLEERGDWSRGAS
ncbi:MAG: competence/damage-inducible protein A [Candidatus Brocadiia bacterium]